MCLHQIGKQILSLSIGYHLMDSHLRPQSGKGGNQAWPAFRTKIPDICQKFHAEPVWAALRQAVTHTAIVSYAPDQDPPHTDMSWIIQPDDGVGAGQTNRKRVAVIAIHDPGWRGAKLLYQRQPFFSCVAIQPGRQ
jgi:hypothetical protein